MILRNNKTLLPNTMSYFFDQDDLMKSVVLTSKRIAEKCHEEDCNYEDIFGYWLPNFYNPEKENIEKRLRHWPYVKRKLLDLIIAESLFNEHKLGLVGGNSGSAYVGENTLNLRKLRLAQNKKFLENMAVQTTNGVVKLSELTMSAHSKFCELYLMCMGMETMACDKGYRAVFITATAPPYLHPNPTKGKNSWNGQNVTAAQDVIKERWDAFKRDLSRPKYNVKFSKGNAFGFRVVEPHEDGTPHWHILMYASLEDIEQKITPLAEKHFGFGSSPFSVKVDLIKTKDEDESAASPTSYMTKYLMKNVDFREGLDEPRVDESVKDSQALDKVDAWKSALKLRSFQTFGIRAARTKWRMIRKLDQQLDVEFADTPLQARLTKKMNNSLERAKRAKYKWQKDFYYKNYSEARNRHFEIEKTRGFNLDIEFDCTSQVDWVDAIKLLAVTCTTNQSREKGKFAEFLKLLNSVEKNGHSIYIKERYENMYGEPADRM